MIPREILKKVRQIEIRTRGLVNDLFGGEYHSVFKGRGMAFSEVREYVPGDDIRLIDWNVTARTGAPFIKIFEEERELSVILMVDMSGSGQFGSKSRLKTELAAELASVLGFSAIKNNDKVGVIFFTDDVEKYIPPKKGRSHILRVIREILYFKPEKKGTSLQNALDFLLHTSHRRSVVFLISDFMNEGYWKSLKIANRKHDLIGIQIHDHAEDNIPNLGMVKVKDPETSEVFWIDTSSTSDRQAIKELRQKSKDDFLKTCRKNRFDLIPISTQDDYVEPLMNYFRLREKRF
ncbi:MAG: DUF58 domain-containing protein [Candidatus Marinimicrobia bacterium]|jgi:uncharacterized protein (DUF58 family)|nr:DUF58 domain-containing protein [Candidatus Neomarinimicrobiota bacterium]MBT3618449.1 DUF58 domain-containing protein [Candidatus Neomarinimicrobiota bacterium]MBT3828995.1 DUF58 domain-containing protein [Candidatus Neomarinimicrobiota bacterium]MBT3997962.1 DUF58 domain-containing protein [Candidatus Neomarinimicrobiota bacterium]MBT4280044.1 DUF58 domain-containing protein [Candidatus Neomarinimicrobiota bacterium]